MPFRRKSHAARSEKENVVVPQPGAASHACNKCNGSSARPLSPRLVRCQSDNTQRIAAQFHGNKASHRNGTLSTETKLSNLMELNASLVKEIAALRAFRSDAEEKLSQQESHLVSERRLLNLELSHLKDEVSRLLEEKQSILAHNQELKVSIKSLQFETSQKLIVDRDALIAAEERACSADSDIERLTFENNKLAEESRRLKGDVNVLDAEKCSNLTKIEQLKDDLASPLDREKDLNQLIHMEKLSVCDTRDKLQKMACQIDVLTNDKERIILDHATRIEEMESMCRKIKERYQTMCVDANVAKNQLEVENNSFKENIALFQVQISHLETDRNALTAERLSILSRNEDLQNELASSLGREAELKQSIKSEKRALDEATDRLHHMHSKVESLNAEKQQMIQKHNSQMEEICSRYREMEQLLRTMSINADSLKTQLEVEKARHEAAVKSLEAAAHCASVEASARFSSLEDVHQNTLNDLRLQVAEEKKNSDSEMSCLRLQIDALSDEKKALQNCNMDLQEVLSGLKQENSKLSNQLERSHNYLQDLQKSLHAAESDAKLLRADRDQLAENADRLIEEISKGDLERRSLLIEKGRILEERDATVSSLTLKFDNLSYQLEAARKDLAAAQGSISSLIHEKQTFVSEAEKLREALTKQLDEKKRQMEAAQESMHSLETANDALIKKINAFECSSSELAVKNNSLSKELAAEKEIKVAFEGQVENLRHLNAKLIDQIASLKNQVSILEQQEKEVIKEAQEMHEKVKDMENRISEYRRREQNLQDDITKERKSANEALTDLRKQIGEEISGRASVEEKNVALVGQVESLSQLNNNLVDEIAFLKDQLATVNGEKAEALMAKEETCNEMKKTISVHQSAVKSLTEQLSIEKAAAISLQERLSEEMRSKSAFERDSLVLKTEVEELKTKVFQQNECLQNKMKQLDLMTKEKIELGEQRDLMSKLISEVKEKLYAEEKARIVAEESASSLRGQVDDLRLLNSKLVDQISSQKRQIEHLEFQVLELLKEKQEMGNECNSKENLIDQLTKEVADTKDQLKGERMARGLLEDTVKKLSADEKTADDSIKAVTSEVESLRVDNEKLLHENLCYQQKVAQLEIEKERSVMENNDDRFKLEALVDEYRSLADQLAVKNATLQKEAAQLSLANEALSIDKLKLENSLSLLTSKYQNVTDQLEVEKEAQVFAQSKYSSEVDRFRAENDKLITINNDLMSTTMVLENKVKHLALEDGKKEEQLLSLNKQLVSLRNSSNALECTLATEKAITESLQKANITLEGTLKSKNEAADMLQVQLAEKCNQIAVLDSQNRCMLERQHELEMQLRELQENFKSQLATLQNECEAKESLNIVMNTELTDLKQQLEETTANKVLLNNQLSATVERHAAMNEALEKDRVLKNEEIRSLTVQLQEISRKVAQLESDLVEEKGKNVSLESQVQQMQGEILVAREVIVNAEKQIDAGQKWESVLTEANRKIELLEAQLAEMASDNVEEKAETEKSSRTRFHVMRVKSRGKGSLDPPLAKMENNADNGELSMQRQFCSSSNIRSLERSEGVASKSDTSVGEKAKVVRLALPVVLISAASSVLIAGIQSYLRRIEN